MARFSLALLIIIAFTTALLSVSCILNSLADNKSLVLAQPKLSATPDTILVLTASNGLVKVENWHKALIKTYELSATLPQDKDRDLGRFMALSRSGDLLYIMLSGLMTNTYQIAQFNLYEDRIQTIHTFAVIGNINIRSLIIGQKTGNLYIFGNDSRGAFVSIRHAQTMVELKHWLLRGKDADWWIYQGAVSDDERHFYVSYHGTDTTGIDYFTLKDDRLIRCPSVVSMPKGCLNAHGGFALWQQGILATTGEGPILQLDLNGRILHQYATGLDGNHLMGFGLDIVYARLYPIGSCGYVGGISLIDLKNSKPSIIHPYSESKLCGERVEVSPDASWLVIASNEKPVADATKPGKLLVVSTDSGKILETLKISSEIIDMLIIKSKIGQ